MIRRSTAKDAQDDVKYETTEASNKGVKNKFHNITCQRVLTFGLAIGIAWLVCLYFEIQKTSFIMTLIGPAKPTPSHSSTFESAAVASDAGPCSEVGRDILQRGGSVVDSAIAAMLCVGMINCHSVGIGGGFVMTIYNATTGKATFINARDIAPAKAEQNMFKGNPELSVLGSLSVALPGQISGFWEAHKRFGVLPWKELFCPSIKMAQDGVEVSPALAKMIAFKKQNIQDRSLNMWKVFENEDGSIKVAGDIVYRPQLVKTLQTIANEGSDAFYKGQLARDIVQDLEDAYGDNIITEKDLNNYKAEIKDALSVKIDNKILFTPGPPAGGAVLTLMLNILDGYNFSPKDLQSNEAKTLAYHRIIEAFRFAYAKRSSLGDDRDNPQVTQLVKNMTADWYADAIRSKIDDSRTYPVAHYDPDFVVPDDHGTAHLSIVGPNGDAVALTSTINLYFGSKVIGERTGILFNNVMDDFSSPNITNTFGVPPSPTNFIKPGNRPLSTMSPSILVEKDQEKQLNKVRMVVGGSGGTKIPTAVALTIINSLYFDMDVGSSVEMKRLHNQLMPSLTTFEEGFEKEVIDGLARKGHTMERAGVTPAVVQAVVVTPDGKIQAASDSRKGGYPAGY